jgi:hypothetical protein
LKGIRCSWRSSFALTLTATVPLASIATARLMLQTNQAARTKIFNEVADDGNGSTREKLNVSKASPHYHNDQTLRGVRRTGQSSGYACPHK